MMGVTWKRVVVCSSFMNRHTCVSTWEVVSGVVQKNTGDDGHSHFIWFWVTQNTSHITHHNNTSLTFQPCQDCTCLPLGPPSLLLHTSTITANQKLLTEIPILTRHDTDMKIHIIFKI